MIWSGKTERLGIHLLTDKCFCVLIDVWGFQTGKSSIQGVDINQPLTLTQGGFPSHLVDVKRLSFVFNLLKNYLVTVTEKCS